MDQGGRAKAMKRVGGLWDRIVSFENLRAASRSARRGKRFRQNVMEFEHEVERNLLEIRDQLLAKTWRPGPYREKIILEPKVRKISAAPYEDRVVHHALVRVIEPVFESRFIHHSYACRKGRGTHAAVDTFQGFLRRREWCLKMDIEKFFPSMDHEILFEIICRKVKCEDTLWLIKTIIDSSNPQEAVWRYFRGDDLFTPTTRRRGVPIGNLTSQFFANVMLDPLDHFITEKLRLGLYLRYCDDSAAFDDSKDRLISARSAIRDFLEDYRLLLHPAKCHVFRSRRGSPFLGYRVLRSHRRLLPDNIRSFKKRMKAKMKSFRTGQLTTSEATASVVSWIAHAKHADTKGLRQALLSKVVFSR